QAPALLVPERERVHAVEFADEVIAVLLVRMHDDLGVTAGTEAVPGLLETSSELAEVVDLAVAHDPQPLVLVGDGLMTAREIDDGEAAHPEQDVTVDEVAVIIGTAMNRDAAHARVQGRIRRRPAGEAEQSVDAAHVLVDLELAERVSHRA